MVRTIGWEVYKHYLKRCGHIMESNISITTMYALIYTIKIE
jgi:hypothetical protein